MPAATTSRPAFPAARSGGFTSPGLTASRSLRAECRRLDPVSISRLAARVLAAKERTWLTVMTYHPAQATPAFEAAGQALFRSELLMGIDLIRHPYRALEAAYVCDVRAGAL
jgi:hypothetical protein